MPSNPAVKGNVRRSQLITTYGVGSVVPVRDESVMIAGLDRWTVDTPDIHEPRLERHLQVEGFILPPADDSGHNVPVVRFPTMHYCPKCRRLNRYSFFTGKHDGLCNTCQTQLVPSRFVVVCEHGHIDDFPYFQWVHAGHKPRDGKHELRINAGGVSASLQDIEISCSCGVPPRTMQGAFGRDALRFVQPQCSGRRPWLNDKVECSLNPRTLQRGASNVYFSNISSAISIPPWSEGAFKVLNRHWTILRYMPEDALAGVISRLNVTQNGAYTVEDLVDAVKLRKQTESGTGELSTSETALRLQEYDALVHGKPEQSREQEFVCQRTVVIGEAAEWFERVMSVTRLREVRAQHSFSRLLPPSPSDGPERRAPLSKEPSNWLPAIEVIGEGVFLRFNMERLQIWEERPEVKQRADFIDRNYVKRFAESGSAPDRTITPRHILIHTFAHALINEWALASGYPAAALRERLYVSDEMAGVLIYTATTDSAGSLGGVVAQAIGDRLSTSLKDALERAAWCSSDPLCIEAEAAGTDALNLAACHACILLPEVSCEESNTLLDRAMLIGTPEVPELGFFYALLGS